MKLYFSPLACSLASRIAVYEAGASVTFVEVDPKTKRTLDGDDYLTTNGLGLVPALVLDDGEVLLENAAILPYLADTHPEGGLSLADPRARTRVQQWLGFVGTELHKPLFVPLLDPAAPADARSYALAKGTPRLDWLDRQLVGREFLLDRPSVADAYLFAILNWTAVTPVSLDRWPSIRAYHRGLLRRPAFATALAEERPLYLAELARHGAAKAEIEAIAAAAL